MNAAIYLRISLDRTGEHLGVDRQREDCIALADSLGWSVVAEYADNDISAASGKARPGYRKMLADIETGKVEAIIAWAPDRLYRRATDLEDLIAVLEAHGVVVRTVKAGDLDLSSAYGRMIARILGAVAAGEGEIKSDRWRRSIRQRRESGIPPTWGPRMFGYARTGEVIDAEAALIRTWATEIIEGSSLVGLVRTINAAGHLTTLGNTWKVASLRKLLTNPRLAGRSTLSQLVATGQKDAVGKPVMRQVANVVGVGQWEAILTDEVYEQTRAMLTLRSGRSRRPRVALLAGLIFCDLCGTPLVTGGRAGRGDTPAQRIYRCTKVPGGVAGCGRTSADALAVETTVELYAEMRLGSPAIRRRAADLRSSSTGLVGEIATLEGRLVELEHQLDEPGTPVATITRAIDRTQTRIDDLIKRLAMSSTTVPDVTAGATWPTDLARRRALVDLVVARVDLRQARTGGAFDPERVAITPR